MGKIVYSPDPIFLGKDQQCKEVDVTTDTVVGDFLAHVGLKLNAPVRIYVNSEEIARDDWTTYKPAVNDIVTVKADVHGDNVLPILLSIALVAVAGPAGAAVAASSFGAALGISGVVATGIITIAGSLLINLLFAADIPEQDTGSATSPTYNLNGASNTARLGEVIPIVIGKTLYVPDLAAKPFTSYRGEDSWIYVSYHFGLNTDITVSDLKIGNNAIDDFDDVDYAFSPGNTGILDNYPGNVDEAPGGIVEKPDGNEAPITRTTSTETTAIEVDVEAILFRYNKKGQLRFNQVVFDLEYRAVGSGTWIPFIGVDKQTTIGNDSQKPLRKTYRLEVTEDQYEVRLTRKSSDENKTDRSSSMQWTKLRSFQPDDADYSQMKRMSMSIRASGQLNGVVQNLSAVVSAECESWNGSAWVLTENQNPAWWFRYLSLGVYHPTTGQLMFGGGLIDDDLDLDALKSWGEYCDTNNLRIGLVFDRNFVLGDALNTIARLGRGSVSFSSGKLGVVVDEADLPVKQLIGEPDIIKDSFSINFISEQRADQVILEFRNEDDGYELDQVKATVPGVSNPLRPATIRMPGLINKDQAGKEVLLSAALNFYRRAIVSFETDYTGYNVSRGDVVSVSHSLPGWGESGRLVAGAGAGSSLLYIDHEVTFEGGGPWYVRVRHADGTLETREVLQNGATTESLVLASALSQDPYSYTNNSYQDLVWQFDASSNPGQRLKILTVQPTSEGSSRVRFVCNIDDENYYNSETGEYDYDTIFRTFNQGVATVSNLGVREQLETPEGPITLHITWDLEDARGVRLSIKVHDDDNSGTDIEYIDLGNIEGRYYAYSMEYPGTVTIRATALPQDTGKMSANTITDTFFIQGIFLNDDLIPILPPVTGLELQNSVQGNDSAFYGKDAKFVWNKGESGIPELGNEENNIGSDYGSFQDGVWRDFQVEILDEDGSLRRQEFTTDNFYTYTFEKNKEDSEKLTVGSPAERAFTINVTNRGRQNQLSSTSALSVINPAPEEPTGISTSSGFGTISINLKQPDTDHDYEGIIAWMDTSTGFTPAGQDEGEGNVVYRGKNNNILISDLDSNQDYYIRIAGYDSFNRDPNQLNLTSELLQTTVPSIEEVVIDEVVFDGIVLSGNDPSTDNISWTAGNATWNNGDSTQVFSIDAGQAAYGGTKLYIYYTKGDDKLQVTTSPGIAVAVENRTLGTYSGGTEYVDSNGNAYLDGSQLYAASILGNKIIAGEINSNLLAAESVIAGKVAADAITGNEILGGSVTATDGIFQNGAIQNADIGTAEVGTLTVAGNAITANATATRTTPFLITNSPDDYSAPAWSPWITVHSVVVDGGVPGALVGSFLILSSVWTMKQYTGSSGSNSDTLRVQQRLARSDGANASGTTEPDYGITFHPAIPPTSLGSGGSDAYISDNTAMPWRNNSGSYYWQFPFMMIAPVNTTAGLQTYVLQVRYGQSSGGGGSNINGTLTTENQDGDVDMILSASGAKR